MKQWILTLERDIYTFPSVHDVFKFLRDHKIAVFHLESVVASRRKRILTH